MVKRPPVVWIAQILLVIFTVLLVFTLLMDVAIILTRLNESSSLVPAVIVLAVLGLVVVLFATSFWGMVKAKRFGRWLGLASLMLVWALIILSQLRPADGPFKRFEYDNTAQVVGAIIAQFLVHGLFLLLVLRLAFARKVSEFFRQGAAQQIVEREPR